MQMIKQSTAWRNARKTRPTEQMRQICVFRFALLENLLKMIPECACMNALMVRLLTIMLESVWRFVQPLLTYMETTVLTHAWKFVPKTQTRMPTILPGSVSLTVHFLNQLLQIG